MSLLPATQFTDWTDYGYSSFYKRYVAGLRAIAQRRYKLSGEEAEALSHAFIAEQSLVENGGLLGSFDRTRHFRRYVVTAFLNHCRRNLKGGSPDPLDEELTAPPTDDPAWNLLAEEAERLRQRVRHAVEVARASLLGRGALTPPERAYLQLKWPKDPGQPPLSDREVADLLQEKGLVKSATPASLVRATCRIGDRVGTRLLGRLRGLLEEEYRRTLPAGDIPRETTLSLNAIVHVLQLEEA